MSKKAFVFAGQGAQYVGMGQSLYETSALAKEMFDQANEHVDFDLVKMCFEGPEELLKCTTYTQPAIFTTSAVCLALLQQHNITADVVAGFSLGEYNALQAAGVFSFEDGVKIVAKRGEMMNEGASHGKMAAVLGLESDVVIATCLEASAKGVVEAANLNCPGQVVIAGEEEALAYAIELLKEKKARRVLELPVGGAFHTSLLKETAQAFGTFLETQSLQDPTLPIVLNVTGNFYDESTALLPQVVAQMHSSVRFEASIREMIASGVDTFVEIGPGKTLSGFIKKIDKSVNVLNVSDAASLQSTIEALRSDV